MLKLNNKHVVDARDYSISLKVSYKTYWRQIQYQKKGGQKSAGKSLNWDKHTINHMKTELIHNECCILIVYFFYYTQWNYKNKVEKNGESIIAKKKINLF